MIEVVLQSLRTPLVRSEFDDRLPGPGEIRVKDGACGVCRTDLHVADGDLPDPVLLIIRAVSDRTDDLKPLDAFVFASIFIRTGVPPDRMIL